jgi:hypothetical protein
MKKRNTLILVCLAMLIFGPMSIFAQNTATNSGGQINQIQPSIIVIPYKKEGEKYRKILENPNTGFQKRIAISRVKEAFDSRGFTTYDFEAELKKGETAGAFSADAQTDEKDVIVKNSGADIFVVVDINVEKGQSGTDVKIILQAYESATGRSLTNKDASSGKFYTEDISKLAGKAIDVMKEDFLNVLQTKFTDIVNNGRSLYMEFVVSQSATINFQSEVGGDGDLLSELIMEWMKKNSYKNYAKKGGSTALKIIYDDVRIPLKRQDDGSNYEVEEFGKILRKYLRSIGVTATIEYPRGQIVVTIN